MKGNIFLLIISMLLCFVALNSKAGVPDAGIKTPSTNATGVSTMTPEQKQARLLQINKRIEAIQDTDLTQMSKEDRKELRAELKGLRHEESGLRGGGLAVSIGAGVVVLVLVGLLSGL